MPRTGEVLKLILEPRDPAPHLPKRLNGLFRALRGEALPGDPTGEPSEIEDLIWAVWADHPDPRASRTMEAAVAALVRRDAETARALLDGLVEAHPDWPEAWNKRATLLFVLEQDAESLEDIARTLSIEPRHFGALCGFAQICLRRGERVAAAAALERAIRLNPHLEAAKAALAALAPEPPEMLN